MRKLLSLFHYAKKYWLSLDVVKRDVLLMQLRSGFTSLYFIDAILFYRHSHSNTCLTNATFFSTVGSNAMPISSNIVAQTSNAFVPALYDLYVNLFPYRKNNEVPGCALPP